MTPAPLTEEIEELLTAYVGGAGEVELFRASELGRSLVDRGVPPDELVAAHVGATQRILPRLSPAAVMDAVLKSYQLLLEALMAYSLAFRQAAAPAPASGLAAAEPWTTPPGGVESSPAPSVTGSLELRDLYEAAQERATRFRDLVDVGRSLIGARRIEDELRPALERLLALVDASFAGVWLVGQAEPAVDAGILPGAVGSIEDAIGEALDGLQPVIREVEGRGEPGGGRAVVATPLLTAQSTAVATLVVVFARPAALLGPDEVDIVQLLAGQLGAAVETSLLHGRLERSIRLLAALNEAGRELLATFEAEGRIRLLVHHTLAVDGVGGAVLRLGSRGRMRRVYAAGDEALVARAERSAALRELRQEAVRAAQPRSSGTGRAPRRVSAWYAPLLVRGQLSGMLEAYANSAEPPEDVAVMLEGLAHLGASAIENARLYQAVTEHEQVLQRFVAQLITAQEEERRRVAYDVHDGLAQITAATYQQLQALAHRYQPRSEEGRQRLARSLSTAHQAVSEARRVIAGLRPTVLDDFGLAAAIQEEVQALRADGWEVSYEDRLSPERLPSSAETTLYRVAQEALTNVRKHAGQAPVEVILERDRGNIRLEVRDRGKGFSTQPRRAAAGEQVGVAGMQERLSLVGGRLAITSRPGRGTRILATVPLAPS
jgi:signal transduction histidine kinase